MAILSYGPYYESKIQSKEKTKKALTGQGYTPEELAGATYGELMARYKDAEVRRQQEVDVALREQQLGLYGRQIRGQEKAAKSKEMGEAISGIATGINVLDKVGALKWGGDVLKTGGKALTGLVSPSVDTGGAVWQGVPYTSYADFVGATPDVVDYAATAYDFYDPNYYTTATDTIATAASGGTVVCTELYRQGLLDKKTYLADSAYGALLDDEVLAGYRAWGEGVARLMGKSRIFTQIVSIFAIPWAKEMAYQMRVLEKGHWLGKIMNIIGIPICRGLGKIMIGGGLRCQTG